MTVNRQVGYNHGTTSIRGTNLNLATVGAGFTVTRFACTWKMIFAQVSGVGTYIPNGVWGVALQYADTGNNPNAWNSAGSDASILAFDNAEPVGLERVFWAPNTSNASIVATFAGTLAWRGQLLLPSTKDFHIVPVDVTNAASTFTLSVAWGIWYG